MVKLGRSVAAPQSHGAGGEVLVRKRKRKGGTGSTARKRRPSEIRPHDQEKKTPVGPTKKKGKRFVMKSQEKMEPLRKSDVNVSRLPFSERGKKQKISHGMVEIGERCERKQENSGGREKSWARRPSRAESCREKERRVFTLKKKKEGGLFRREEEKRRGQVLVGANLRAGRAYLELMKPMGSGIDRRSRFRIRDHHV